MYMPYCVRIEFGLEPGLEGIKFKVVGCDDPFLTAELGAGLPLDSEPTAELTAAMIALANDDYTWKSAGSCVGADPDLFFPERGESVKEAKAICEGCEIREECLEFALTNGEKFGIWGGLSERERRVIRRNRKLALVALND